MAIEHIEGVRAAADDLSAFLESAFRAVGMSEESGAATARALVDASSRGVDTHGVRLAPWYVPMVEGGRINRSPRVTFEKKAGAVGHVDGDGGFGHLPSFRAIEEGCKLAETSGIAAVSVGRSMHHGATGVYTLEAARRGFAAIGMTHADPAVVPHGGVKPFYGTNPISFATPAPGEEPMLLDMATSAIPYNRVHLRRVTGTPLPPEVAVDAAGAPTRDPHAVAALVPLGGLEFGYKGAGVSAMVDVLCSAFTGMPNGARLASFGGDMSQPIHIGHFFMILRPEAFQALAAFDARVGDFLSDLRSQPAKPGAKVMAPGDVEKAEAAERTRRGVPVDASTWAEFRALAQRFRLRLPDAHPTNAEREAHA
jgi:ureidoglycolate dehydrogenase (NAD+)